MSPWQHSIVCGNHLLPYLFNFVNYCHFFLHTIPQCATFYAFIEEIVQRLLMPVTSRNL